LRLGELPGDIPEVCAMKALFFAACIAATVGVPVPPISAPGLPPRTPHATSDGGGPVALPSRESDFYRSKPVEGIDTMSPMDGDEVVEGQEVTICWLSAPEVRFVKLSYSGEKCPLGGRSRGEFGEAITGVIPNKNLLTWTVPWMDALQFRLHIAGFDAQKKPVADDIRALLFRPKEMAGLGGTVIVISKARQRLYYQQDGIIKRMHLVSTGARGYGTPNMSPSDRYKGRVFRKMTTAWSRKYTVWMPFFLAVTSSGSHGIHATSPGYYRRLGSPASHGCIRQHRADAQILYGMVDVGTPVYIF
jgi:hypothetical protein